LLLNLLSLFSKKLLLNQSAVNESDVARRRALVLSVEKKNLFTNNL